MEVRVHVYHKTEDEAGYLHDVTEIKTFVAESEEDLELIESHLIDYYKGENVWWTIWDRHLLDFKEDE